MNFITKQKLIAGGTAHFAKPYEKPSTCPFCGIETDATVISVTQIVHRKDSTLFVVSCQCTHCENRFVALYERVKTTDKDGLEYIEVLPRPKGKALPACLSTISPRFEDAHSEAEGAETFGFTNLAAIGYRRALEILIKDFAIVELGKSEEEVASKKLEVAIATYLQQEQLMNTADVVRILGNDHTHYKEKYPEHDFSLLKHYYDIFLRLVVTQYEINHPPVKRQQKG